ncbi:MAG: helix-turn-helix transcriptional regulator [Lachnospiraceae bacterium]|nr:helix-turn-helix transcriptional regulator [Lachnospiraceae bacterium]
MGVGENIKKIRKEKGLTQKELGELLGISQAAIGQFENSRSNPHVATVKKIASALGVKLFDIIEVNDYFEQIRLEKEDSLIEYLYKLGIEIESIDGYSYSVNYQKKKYIISDTEYDKLIYSIGAFTKFTIDDLLTGNEVPEEPPQE